MANASQVQIRNPPKATQRRKPPQSAIHPSEGCLIASSVQSLNCVAPKRSQKQLVPEASDG
eukprot:5634848-Alexandrium_andersonii.AAC.1